MSTESGTYTFEQRANELPYEPLTISGPPEELKNIRDGLLYLMLRCDREGWVCMGASAARLHDKVVEAIKDTEFESRTDSEGN